MIKMSTYLLYQLFMSCSLMVYQNYCMKSEPRYAKLFNENEILITSDESREKTVEKERLAVNFNKYTFVAHLCQYPYHVAIISKIDNLGLCQGALITFNWILTSNSCFKKYSKNLDTIYVVSGAVNTMDPKAIINTISHAVYYPELEPVTGASDLVLVKLKEDVEDQNGCMKTIALSKYKYPIETNCKYSSFDYHINMKDIPTVEYRLYGRNIQLLNQSQCKNFPKESTQVMKYHCAGFKDFPSSMNIHLNSKTTHVGAPLVCNNQLYGIKTNNELFSATNNIKSWVDSVIKI